MEMSSTQKSAMMAEGNKSCELQQPSFGRKTANNCLLVINGTRLTPKMVLYNWNNELRKIDY